MNKFILIALVVVAIMAYMEVSFGSFEDDYIRYPTTRFRRDLELEELHGAGGDHVKASRRAVDRIRRMNREEELAIYRRFSGGVDPDEYAEDEDEDEEEERSMRCITDDVNARKRRAARSTDEPTCWRPTCFSEPIKVWLHKSCTEHEKVKNRLMMVMSHYTSWGNCSFDGDFVASSSSVETDADITIKCQANKGNYCPIGKSSYFKTCNIEPIMKAGKPRTMTQKLPFHELGHLCGLGHTQQLPGSDNVLEKDYECIISEYKAQYEEPPYKCVEEFGYVDDETFIDPSSIMEYMDNGFLMTGCTKNIFIKKDTQFAQDVLNMNKLPDVVDFSIIKSCGPQMDNTRSDPCSRGEMDSGGTIILYTKLSGVNFISVERNGEPFTYIHTCSGEESVQGYQCNNGKLQATRHIWSVADPCKGNKKGFIKIVSGWNCFLQTMSYMCGHDSNDEDGFKIHGDWIVVEGNCKSGTSSLTLTCTSKD